MGKRCCGKPFCSPTTTPTTWPSSWTFAARSTSGLGPDLVLRPPAQRHRAVHRMHHGSAGPARFQEIGLKGEIPLGGAVGVVNEAQARMVLQTSRLLDHRLRGLPQKGLGKDAKDADGQAHLTGLQEI